MTKSASNGESPLPQAEGGPLKGKVALVTGALGGLGKAIVAELRKRGAEVHGVDIAGDDVFHADLATASGNRDMVGHVLKKTGRLDILVLNAGSQYVAPIEDFPDTEWERLRALMMDGPFYAMKAAWPALRKSSSGRVVVTASTSSFMGAPGKTAYTAAKHGVLGLVRAAALEGAPHGVTVNAVAPGWMDTSMMRGQLEVQAATMGISKDEVIARFRAAQPAKRFVEAQEVAETVAFFASPGASGVNGVCVSITT
jgi:3-hydroxybutyrate dehydrogenase